MTERIAFLMKDLVLLAVSFYRKRLALAVWTGSVSRLMLTL
jgi:hypothetical protein